MSKLKIIKFTAIFYMLFCTAELYALETNELKLEKQKTTFSLDVIMKPLGGAVNGLGKSLDETVNGIGKSIGGTVNGLGKSIDATVNDVGDFLEETVEVAEDVAEVAIVTAAVFLYMIAETDYYYDHGHYSGHNHGYHRW